jgi:hypothetical protein
MASALIASRVALAAISPSWNAVTGCFFLKKYELYHWLYITAFI